MSIDTVQPETTVRATTNNKRATTPPPSLPGHTDHRELVDGVWGALQVVCPQGIEQAQLEEIAAVVGVAPDVLLGDDPDLLPDLTAPPGDGDVGMTAPQASAAPGMPERDLSRLALLSAAPHTRRDGATPLNEIVRSVLHHLGANKTRGVLTMLGIIIGVGAVVLLLAIGNGLLGYVNDLTGQYGANNVTIQPARLVVNGIDTGMLTRSLSLADAEALADRANVPDAIAVSPTMQMRATTHAGNANIATTVVGVWPDYVTAGGYDLTTGSFVSADDDQQGTLVAVLGANVATTLFGSEDPVGKTIWINGVSFRVIGQMAALESQITGGDDWVFVPLSTFQAHVNKGQPSTVDATTAIDSVVIRASASTTIGMVQDESTTLLTARHHLGDAPPDFKITSYLTALQQRAQILAAVNAFMAVVAGISLLVGGIGIMNIMLVSVAERTREIGLRKAIGARGRDILTQFLVESMLISLVGAGIGVGVAAVLVALVSVLWRPCPPSVIGSIIAVLAALATGLFFGVSPAKRAASLQPIDALRAE